MRRIVLYLAIVLGLSGCGLGPAAIAGIVGGIASGIGAAAAYYVETMPSPTPTPEPSASPTATPSPQASATPLASPTPAK